MAEYPKLFTNCELPKIVSATGASNLWPPLLSYSPNQGDGYYTWTDNKTGGSPPNLIGSMPNVDQGVDQSHPDEILQGIPSCVVKGCHAVCFQESWKSSLGSMNHITYSKFCYNHREEYNFLECPLCEKETYILKYDYLCDKCGKE
jgi:hypothetical protein